MSDAAIAVRRFGLGPRPGDLKRISGDPRGYVEAALGKLDAVAISAPGLETSQENFVRIFDAQRAVREARAATATPAMPGSGAPTPAVEKSTDAEKPGEVRKEVFQEEAAARIDHAVATDAAVLERLVQFWSNHFCVSALKGPQVRVLAGAFEREAIRPHILGRFADMLRAVVQHPAMLIYLDNAQSIGPSSKAGLQRARGLNENLAREILELHTLGVDGGYSQTDVTAFARVITGWTVHGAQPHPTLKHGQFQFARERHEPGPQTILSKRYEDRGLATGEQVLADLARHPATARHIARKLARHFVGDDAPPALVAALEKTFRDTDGDLKHVAATLIRHPDAWQPPARKVVPPYEFIVSLVRAFGLQVKTPEALRLMGLLGQPLWQPPSPKGWPDDDGAWMGPSVIRERLRIAERFGREIVKAGDPRELAADLLGAASAPHVRQVVARAETREQAAHLLIMSPEFLKR